MFEDKRLVFTYIAEIVNKMYTSVLIYMAHLKFWDSDF